MLKFSQINDSDTDSKSTRSYFLETCNGGINEIAAIVFYCNADIHEHIGPVFSWAN